MLSYREFGELFILAAATPERVVGAVKRIAGDSVELGPLRAGPGRAATVMARGTIGEPVAEEIDSEFLAYSVELPVRLGLDVRVGTTGRFEATGQINLRLGIRTVRPLAIVVDVDEVAPSDTSFVVRALGVQSKLFQLAADVERELRRHAAAFVNDQVARPDAARLTRIDLMPLIEKGWADL